MRTLYSAFFLIAASSICVQAESSTTALSAIKLLPKGESKRIARIEAREGNPTPDRWYIIVHHPDEESGLHEYVVAGGAVVASRALSQFAESVKLEEVIGSEALKIDSDRAGRVAQQYAVANNVVPALFSYQLHKDADDGLPVWNVTCVDPAGKALGGVVLAASKGTVLSHTGFALEPSAEKQREESARTNRKRYMVRRPELRPMPPPPKPNFFERMFGR